MATGMPLDGLPNGVLVGLPLFVGIVVGSATWRVSGDIVKAFLPLI